MLVKSTIFLDENVRSTLLSLFCYKNVKSTQRETLAKTNSEGKGNMVLSGSTYPRLLMFPPGHAGSIFWLILPVPCAN